jgi:hypothetical protein
MPGMEVASPIAVRFCPVDTVKKSISPVSEARGDLHTGLVVQPALQHLVGC